MSKSRAIARPRLGRALLAGGGVALVGFAMCAMSLSRPPNVLVTAFLYALAVAAATGLATGGAVLDPRPDAAIVPDRRRAIYAGLTALFAALHAACAWFVLISELPSAQLHLATVPLFTAVAAAGALRGGRAGWWAAMVGASLVIGSTILIIARVLVSAAFLAGVYGAFGKAAATFALVAVALVVELVALLPICHVRFLMSRRGRRAFGL
jgi:hypothetical protein